MNKKYITKFTVRKNGKKVKTYSKLGWAKRAARQLQKSSNYKITISHNCYWE